MSIETQLAAQHRQGQLQIRARALQAFTTIWPLWTGDKASFQQLVTAALPLVSMYRQASSAYASQYYTAARLAAGQTNAFTPPMVVTTNDDQIKASLWVTGEVMTRDALAGGQSPTEAMQTALTRVSGSLGRHVLDAGRDTILQSTRSDPRSSGWVRVVSPTACNFCQMLAGKTGNSEESAGFAAHDFCACMAMPEW